MAEKKPYFKRKHKRSLTHILLAAGLLAGCMALTSFGVLQNHPAVRIAAFAVPYMAVGWRVLQKAARNIAHGRVFDENFLMSLATLGAFCIGEYAEAVFVMLFYRVGELFEELAVGKTRTSIASLMQIRPDTAHVERGGEIVTVNPAEVAVGETILIRPGERVPLDGVITEGSTTLDTSALTGEALPRDAGTGEDMVSGCVNLSGVVRMRVTRVFGESTVARILDLTESAAEHKARSEHFITRFARIYTPLVVAAAFLLAILPPLFFGAGSWPIWREWLGRALTFLVISCPCALVISVPLSFFGGIGGASRKGILIKGSAHMETLAACDTMVFDKTGTLTEGRFSVKEVIPAHGFSVDELLLLAAAVEKHSTHPIARALAAGCDHPPAESDVDPTSVEEIAAHGVIARVRGRRTWHRVAVGNTRLMAYENAHVPPHSADATKTTVYVSVDGAYAGRITIADSVRPEASEALAALRACGIRHTIMLTGDSPAVAEAIASDLGMTEVHAGLLPIDKVERIERCLTAHAASGRKVAFVGDGINDAPVLARVDVGIAMGGMGSDAAIEAADIVLMNDRLSALPAAVCLARKTIRIVRQNIVFALAVKAAVLLLGALGPVPLWLAVFADVGVSVLAILNAMRAMK